MFVVLLVVVFLLMLLRVVVVDAVVISCVFMMLALVSWYGLGSMMTVLSALFWFDIP